MKVKGNYWPMDAKFSWTQEYKRSWEENKVQAKKDISVSFKQFKPNKKSIIRHLLVCVDTSASIENPDYLPTVRSALSTALPNFSKLFKNSNPLSFLSFLTCKDVFEKYSREFDSNTILNTIGAKYFSFLNCLKSATEYLKSSNYNKEILLITASIGTKDSGIYDQIINDLKKIGIKVSIVSVSGEVSLFRRITQITNGSFHVPIDFHHFEIILNSFAVPMESLESTSCLIKLGFPKFIQNPGLCTCHLKFEKNLYECPVCRTYICSLPCQCPICDTQLVSPINISKSYYFMYPLKPFDLNNTNSCRRCNRLSYSKCPDCSSFYCENCYKFISEELNFCIYCPQKVIE